MWNCIIISTVSAADISPIRISIFSAIFVPYVFSATLVSVQTFFILLFLYVISNPSLSCSRFTSQVKIFYHVLLQMSIHAVYLTGKLQIVSDIRIALPTTIVSRAFSDFLPYQIARNIFCVTGFSPVVLFSSALAAFSSSMRIISSLASSKPRWV